MSKTNSAQTTASQSVPVSNDALSPSSTKPTFNYAAAAARSSSASRPTPQNASTAAVPAPAPSFASAVVATSSPLASNSSSVKPSGRTPDAAAAVRPSNGTSSIKSPIPTPERKTSLVAPNKSHNIRPSSSHISFGSLADIPAKKDNASVLSSSPANPPTLTRRDGPPVFGSVSADPPKKPVNVPTAGISTAFKPSDAVSTSSGPSTKLEKKKIDFQSFFISRGETVSNPPPPASSGSSPSPSISYRGDPTQHRRNSNNPDSHSAPGASVSPRPSHVAISNGPSASGSFHSPLSGASRAFTPAHAPSPMSQPPHQHHQYGMAPGHWQNGPAPNSPHFIPGNPPMNGALPNYPPSNGTMGGNHPNPSQYHLPKPQHFSQRSGSGGQAGSSNSIYPSSSGRSHHHQSRNGATAPTSPRLPPSNLPNGIQNPNYQHPPNSQGMPPGYWPQAPYPPAGPGPYTPYGYNPNAMPTYPHPSNFPPPQPGQHHSPQLANQTGPSVVPPSAPLPASSSTTALPHSSRAHPAPAPSLPVPSSPVPSNGTYAPPYPPALYSPGITHSRGPSLSYNAPTFSPSASSDFKPHTPNVAAPAFQPRRSAAVAIKKPLVTPISELPEKSEESHASTQNSKSRRAGNSGDKGSHSKASVDSSEQKSKTEEARNPTIGTSDSKEKPEVLRTVEKEKPESLENKKLDELKAAQEAEATAKTVELERQAKEQVEKEAQEQAEKEAKAKAEEEAKQKAEQEAQEKAKQEAQEKAKQEAKAKAEEEAREKTRREAQEKDEHDLQARKELEAKDAVEEQANEPQPQCPVKSAEPAVVNTPAQTTSSPVGSKCNEIPSGTQDEPTPASHLPSKPVNGTALPTTKARPTPIDVNTKALQQPGETLTPSLPSALLSARKIEDLGQVSYPENIQSPRSELNTDAVPGKFRYDRAFLLQFMEVCKDKPVQLPDLDSIGMVDGQSAAINPLSRPQSNSGQRRNPGQLPSSHRGPTGTLTPSGGSMSMMGSGGGVASRTGPGAGMPMFTPAATRNSEERFNQSNRPSMGAMPIGMGLMLPGRPTGSMSRTPSANALPGIMSNGPRDPNRRSGRGSRRDGVPNHPPTSMGSNVNLNRGMTMQQMFEVEAVQPLQPSANSWAAARSTQLEEDSPELVNRKVKALLNKLTLDKFVSISDQVLQWANKSETEHDGRILRQVIALIFEKATDEAHWSEMYAKLCRKLMEKLSPNVKDESLFDNQGNMFHGGNLFRKYLLNRCQEDYERGWSKRDELAAVAAGKAADDAVKQAANEKSRAEAEAAGKDEPNKEAEILSDEYYAAQKAKRQGLGLVRFIGELYKLSMLTERIMHECIKKLLSNIDTPEEEDIESLCRFMMTVGALLDHEKAVQHMNVYFTRMATMAKSPHLSSRARFMIQDVIDTRNNKWVGRNVAAGPKLISQIHEEAAQAAAEQARQQANKNKMNDLSRGGSKGGRHRDQAGGLSNDGWSSVGVPAPVPRPSKAGDLTQFGKVRDISSSVRSTFGPSNVFANKGKLKDGKLPTDREPAVMVAPNPFAALGADTNDTGSGGLTRKPSAAELQPTGRPRLNLAPRTLPLPKPTSTDEASKEEAPKEEADVDDSMASLMVRNRVDEFFHVRSIDEAIKSFSTLPKARHHQLIRSLLETAMEKKASDLELTASLFQKLSKDKVTHDVFMKAFVPVVEQLDDTVVDVLLAYEHCGKLFKASGLSEHDVEQLAQKIDTEQLEAASARLIKCYNSAQVD